MNTVFGRTNGPMELVLCCLDDNRWELCSPEDNQRRAREFLSLAVNLQLVSKDVRRAVKAAGSFWARVLRANFHAIHSDEESFDVIVRRVEQICVLHPPLQVLCETEFEQYLQWIARRVFAFEQVRPLDTVQLAERLCALRPSLKEGCDRAWKALFAGLSGQIVKRDSLPEALGFVQRFHALHPEALEANIHWLNIFVMRFTRLMMHHLYVQFKHDPNARCRFNGRTALMEAVRLESGDAIEEFVQGAFASEPCKRKRKPPHNPYGIDLKVQCDDCMTVFDYLDEAKDARFRDRARTLLETLRSNV
jgi:hypothetical protein